MFPLSILRVNRSYCWYFWKVSRKTTAQVGAMAAATRFSSEDQGGTGVKKFNRGGFIPQDCAGDLKRAHSIAATNLRKIWYKNVKQEAFACDFYNEREYSVNVPGNICVGWGNVSTGHTICVKMPSAGHFFISLTVHASKQFICLWIGLVKNCIIFHKPSLNI